MLKQEDEKMSYRIIGDSSTDLPEALKGNPHIKHVPLTLILDDIAIVDDDTFNQQSFLKQVKASQSGPKSACPSPDDYMKYFDFDGNLYVITLSSQLSGSYNSAELAKKLYLEEHPDKRIDVIDSRSASIGQTLIAMKIIEMEEAGLPYDEIVKQVNTYRDGLLTKFVLESLETFRKNGRLTGLKAFIASTLNIKPVMGNTPEGYIYKVDQARGIEKALRLMVKAIEQDAIKPQEKILGIGHCNNRERAESVKDEIMKRIPFKDYFIADTAGVSSMYANEGGIIAAY